MTVAACCKRSMGTTQVTDCTVSTFSDANFHMPNLYFQPHIKCKTWHCRLEVASSEVSSRLSSSVHLYWSFHTPNYRVGQDLRFFKRCHCTSSKILTSYCGLQGPPWPDSCPQQPHLGLLFHILFDHVDFLSVFLNAQNFPCLSPTIGRMSQEEPYII